MENKAFSAAEKSILLMLLFFAILTIFQLTRMGVLSNSINFSNDGNTMPPTYDSSEVAENTHSSGKVAFVYDETQNHRVYIKENIQNMLELYRISYDSYTAEDELPADAGYTFIIALLGNYDKVPVLQSVLDYVEAGASAYFPLVAVNSDSFISASASFGIIEKTPKWSSIGITDEKGLFGEAGESYPLDAEGSLTYDLSLRNDCDVYFKNDAGNPLFWSRAIGAGRVYIANCDYLSTYHSRGVVAQVFYEALKGNRGQSLITPAFSVSSFSIEDFPSPFQVDSARMLTETRMSQSDFISEKYWPFLARIIKKYKTRLTASYTPSYNENRDEKFDVYLLIPELKTYTTDIVTGGGEIAFHGYSMRPLGLEGELRDEGWFIPWRSVESMKRGFDVGEALITDLLPKYAIRTYFPPQGRISKTAIENMKTIGSGIETMAVPYTQVYLDQDKDFFKTDVSGVYHYATTTGIDNIVWNSMNSLASLGIFSPSIDMNETLRMNKYGFQEFCDTLEAGFDIAERYPVLRKESVLNASRIARSYEDVVYSYIEDESGIDLHIKGFFGGVSFMLRTNDEIAENDAYDLYRYNNAYLIFPKNQDIRIVKGRG